MVDMLLYASCRVWTPATRWFRASKEASEEYQIKTQYTLK